MINQKLRLLLSSQLFVMILDSDTASSAVRTLIGYVESTKLRRIETGAELALS